MEYHKERLNHPGAVGASWLVKRSASSQMLAIPTGIAALCASKPSPNPGVLTDSGLERQHITLTLRVIFSILTLWIQAQF